VVQLEKTHAGFEETPWTLLGALHDGDESARRAATGVLVELYWPPVYAFLRRSGKNRDESAELAQGFFAGVVLQRSLFESADRDRGRLRSLLLQSLKRYVVDQHRRAMARGGDVRVPMEKLGREERMLTTDESLTVEEAFDRRWALVVLHEALRRAEAHYVETGRARHWRAFDARVLRPAMTMAEAPNMATLAGELEFKTPGDAASAVFVVKKRVLAIMNEVIAETVGPDELEEERTYVLSLLGGGIRQ
jgi:RNA polymerase sigma-70 factor (ECF subfamily)